MARPRTKADAPAGDLDALVETYLRENPQGKYGGLYGVELGDTEAGPALLALDRDAQAALVGRLAERLVEYDRELDRARAEHAGNPQRTPAWDEFWTRRHLADLAMRAFLRRKLPLADETILALLGLMSDPTNLSGFYLPLAGIASAVENRSEDGPLGETLTLAIRSALNALRATDADADCRKVEGRLSKLVSAGPSARIDPGEAWSDAALADLGAMDGDRRRAWSALLASCQAAGAGKPSARWLKDVRPLLDAVGRDEFKARVLRWFPLVDRPPAVRIPRESPWEPDWDNLIRPPHVDLLKGLARCASFEADRDLARALAALALSAYRKIPEKGPRLPSLGNAAVASLGAMPGMDAVAQLALLKLKIKFIPAQKEVEKALTAAADREGLPRDEVDELAVPSYGMEEVGRRREVLGDYAVELVVEGQDAALRWSKPPTARRSSRPPPPRRRTTPTQ